MMAPTGQEFVWGNLIFNGAAFTTMSIVLAFFIKRWMKSVEVQAEKNHLEVKDTKEQLVRKMDSICVKVDTVTTRQIQTEKAVAVREAICKERTRHVLIRCEAENKPIGG
jgi:membrane protein implicated in regulation of membrane protease activity